jgi:RNA polymerase sigma-70 factor, ECF subfamily
MLATSANGQPAAAAYVRDQNGSYRAYGICVLTVSDAGILRISSFGDPSLVTAFGFRSDMAQAMDAEPAPPVLDPKVKAF